MLDILQTYLQDTATPELVSAMVDAHALFDEFGLENYEADFEELLMTDGEVDNGQTLISIVALTNQLQRGILEQHSVFLADENDIPTSVFNAILRGLIDIQNYEDGQQLAMVTMLSLTTEEVFAECMALVSDKAPEDFLPYIREVGQFLIVRLRELAYRAPMAQTQPAENHQKQILALKRFDSFLKGKFNDLEVTKLIKDGLSVGYPFVTYLVPAIDEMTPDKAALELLAAAFASSDGVENPRTVIKNHIEHYVASIDLITRIDIEINALLLGLERYEAP